MTFARIAGTGSYLPERVLTNDEIATFVDTSDAWIRERTGIHRRHIVADGESKRFRTVHCPIVSAFRKLAALDIEKRS